MNIAVVPLGCPKNMVDAERMLHLLLTSGHTLSQELFEAEIVLVNTCAFIESAKQEAIENILLLAKRRTQNPNLKIVVTGCLAERYKEEVAQLLPEVDAVVMLGANRDMVKIFDDVASGKREFYNASIDKLPEEGERFFLSPPHMAYLKISEGCNNRCGYCSIPLIRGAQKSRRIESIYEEAQYLVECGVKELVLVSQDTTAFGIDRTGQSEIVPLLETLDTIEKLRTIRIMYAYPTLVTTELCNTMARLPKVAHYIDMPIQHINDEVLKRMLRRGGSKAIYDAVERLLKAMPDIAIRTSVMTGFPGETDEQFLQLLEYVKEGHFTHLGCFAYSKEDGTEAARLQNQLTTKVKKDREAAIMQAQYEIVTQRQTARIGSVVTAVAEDVCTATGRTILRDDYSAPEIDTHILSNENVPLFDYYDVEITGTDGYDLVGHCRSVRG